MVAKAVEDRRSLLMLSFLQAHSLKSIRVKLITIYMLNVSDALLTFWLIGTGYFFEANLLLKKAMFDFDELFLEKYFFQSCSSPGFIFEFTVRRKNSSGLEKLRSIQFCYFTFS